MRTTFLLIRHGMNDLVGRALAGRMPDVHLNEEGRAQARSVADRLAGLPIAAIASSPLDRTRETAEPLAERLGLAIDFRPGLTEVDPGPWAGRAFTDLRGDPAWRAFNAFRGARRIPGGERLISVQERMVAEIDLLSELHPGQLVAVVSHADPIKSLFGHFLGMPVEFWSRLEISPASVSVLALEDWGPIVLGVNQVNGTPAVAPS